MPVASQVRNGLEIALSAPNRKPASAETPSFWKGLTSNRVISIAFFIGVTMALMAGAVAYQVRNQVSKAFTELRETREFELASNGTLAAVVDIETGYRGMLISNEPRVGEPYVKGRSDLAATLTRLSELVRDESDFVPFVESFSTAAREAEKALVAAADRHAANPDFAVDANGIVETKLKVDAVRAEHQKFQEAIRQQLALRRSSIDAILTTLISAIALLVFGIIFISFAQAREVVAQTSHSLRVRSASEAEIASISQDLNASRAELQGITKKLALALRSAHVKVFSLDQNGNVHWASELSIGLLAGRTLPVRLADLTPESEQAMVELRLKEIFAAGETNDFEMMIDQGGLPPRWVRITVAPADLAGDGLCLGSAIDITDIKRREESNFLLMRELSHRSKNLLAITQAMARQTARGAISIKEFEKRFTARLRGLAAAHDLMVNSAYTGAELDQVIRSQIGVIAPGANEQVLLDGPPLRLRPEAVQNLAMAFHELAANAEQYGALSRSEGQANVSWLIEGRDKNAQLHIVWKEIGGPPVTTPERKGFGTALIAQNLPRALMGEVTLDFPPNGVVCSIRLPLRQVTSRPDTEPVS